MSVEYDWMGYAIFGRTGIDVFDAIGFHVVFGYQLNFDLREMVVRALDVKDVYSRWDVVECESTIWHGAVGGIFTIVECDEG